MFRGFRVDDRHWVIIEDMEDPKILDGPQAWTARDFSGPADWVLPVGKETREELKSAAALEREDFPLPSFAPIAEEIRRRLRDGSGFVVLRGLGLDEYGEDAARMLYAGLGKHLGTILPQNLRGDRLYSVRDEGIRVEAEYGRTGVRFSKTNAAFDFHTDSPSRVAGHTPDFIGLLVLRTAKDRRRIRAGERLCSP